MRCVSISMLVALFCFAVVCAAAAVGQDAPRFILDTDIGDDIDDAYALALIASRTDIKLLGVTTAFGQTRERAEVAAKLLSVMGRKDVPVYAGRAGSHVIGRQHEWAKGFESPALKSEPAVMFLKREVERAPGKVTIVAIGPLVNLGDLVTQFPEVRSKIQRIVIMGGSVYLGYNNQAPPTIEWNIRCDPVAAKAVFTSGAPLTMAGLEVTTMMQLDGERRKRIYGYGTPLTDALAALTALWGDHDPTLFDPVAVAFALGHSDCDTEQKRVEVDDQGMTKIVDGTPNVTVLVHPNKDAFLDWYVEALKPVGKH